MLGLKLIKKNLSEANFRGGRPLYAYPGLLIGPALGQARGHGLGLATAMTMTKLRASPNMFWTPNYQVHVLDVPDMARAMVMAMAVVMATAMATAMAMAWLWPWPWSRPRTWPGRGHGHGVPGSFPDRKGLDNVPEQHRINDMFTGLWTDYALRLSGEENPHSFWSQC